MIVPTRFKSASVGIVSEMDRYGKQVQAFLQAPERGSRSDARQSVLPQFLCCT